MSKINFNLRPSPVLVEHRRVYKIAQLLLILENASRAGKSSLPRLQLFNWALKSKARKDCLIKASKTNLLNVHAWGFDPAVAIALRFAVAENLVCNISTGYQISDMGRLFVSEIMKDVEIMQEEKAFIAIVGKNISENMVDVVSKEWKP